MKPLRKTELRQIGRSEYLSGKKLEEYAAFVRKRFPKEQDRQYAREWAGRFAQGTEWAMSDSHSREVLRKVKGDSK